MWKSTKDAEIPSEATFDIWVSKGPMQGVQRECSFFDDGWYNAEDFVAPTSFVTHYRPVVKDVGPNDKIAGRTLNDWAELSRRDDCFNQMVPSDLRVLLMFIG